LDKSVIKEKKTFEYNFKNEAKRNKTKLNFITRTVAASSKRKASSEIRGLTMNDTAATSTTTNNRRGSVDGVITRCGLCSLLSSLLRRAMCVGSRRGSGESYYQELAETAVSLNTFDSFSYLLSAFLIN
jgi:hypothetical protein